MNAARTLFDGIVDYAGLFPPAALDLPTAVRNYASYLAESDAWMLGRFVIPASRLAELDGVLGGFPTVAARPWRFSGLVGADVSGDVERARDFNVAHRSSAVVDTLEAKASSTDEIQRIATATRGEFSTFVELPLAGDLDALLGAIAHHGMFAKIRTGGVVADAFPPAEAIVRFIRACLRAGVPFKATAGLHHPIRAQYRLTYDDDAPTGVMFGYVNVFLAAALMANGMSDEEAVRVLDERDPDAFTLGDDVVGWRGHTLASPAARAVRDRVAVSFGSCSFREPVDELKAMASVSAR